DAQKANLLRVKPGDPANSFLIRKLRGQGPGLPMPQSGGPLPESLILMISDWIARGAKSTAQECGGAEGTPGVCSGGPIQTGDFKWEPEPPLEAPAPGTGIQLYTPKRNVDPGTEWETCYAFQPDWAQIGTQVGLQPGQPLTFKQQTYQMHKGSHH